MKEKLVSNSSLATLITRNLVVEQIEDNLVSTTLEKVVTVLSLPSDDYEQQQGWFHLCPRFSYNVKMSRPTDLILESLKPEGWWEGEASK